MADFVRAVARRFVKDRGPSLAASLTYTTLLALVPLATITLTLITAFPVFDQFTGSTPRFLEQSVLPPPVAHAVLGYVQEFAANARGLTALGLATLALIAFLTMFTIESAFNQIWRVRRTRPLLVRLPIYLGVLTLGPILLGISLTITSFVVSASLGYVQRVPGASTLVVTVVPLALGAIAFTLLYFVVPNRAVAFRHAAAGGALAAVLFELVKRGFALYIQYFPSYSNVYGAFSAVPLFLIWVYASWTVVLLGAVIASLLPERRLDPASAFAHPLPAFADMVDVLRGLMRLAPGSGPHAAGQIAAVAGLSLERCEHALEWLAQTQCVAQARYGRWRLACDPKVVTVAEIYDRFVAEQAARRPRDRIVDALLARTAAEARRALEIPLAALAAGAPPEPRSEDDAVPRFT